ncbi:hypothetical protein [Streptomyces sp. NPDC052179]|uniref:hypothetical protein n=1 Tax=Streptomyces sp. NPDC052179 TaxID=3155680 RepID=UPI0034394A11
MTLEAQGILVNNAYSQSFIPYHEISECGAGPGLVINTKRNGKVFATAFDSSLLGRSVRRKIEKEIADEVKKSRFDPSVGFEKRYTMGTPEVVGPMLSFILFVVALALQ